MPSRTELIRSDLTNLSPSTFISKWIIDSTPYVFNSNYVLYSKWRHDLAGQLRLDPNDIIISGTGSLGVSLNPSKSLLREFNDESDVDIGIVSEHFFNIAWYDLRHINMTSSHLSYKMISAIKDHRERLIYWGTIATDKILPILSFGSEWDKIITSFSKYECLENRDINFRIYKDNKSFRDYLIIGVIKCRDRILEASL